MATYTEATKHQYIPPACSKCGAPAEVEWVEVTPGGFPFPPDDPNIELVPGHTECSARCWEDGYQPPPCPRCGGAAWAHSAEVTEMGQQERSFVLGMHECMSQCSADLSDDEREELHKQYPGWSW